MQRCNEFSLPPNFLQTFFTALTFFKYLQCFSLITVIKKACKVLQYFANIDNNACKVLQILFKYCNKDIMLYRGVVSGWVLAGVCEGVAGVVGKK